MTWRRARYALICNCLAPRRSSGARAGTSRLDGTVSPAVESGMAYTAAGAEREDVHREAGGVLEPFVALGRPSPTVAATPDDALGLTTRTRNFPQDEADGVSIDREVRAGGATAERTPVNDRREGRRPQYS